MLLKNEKIDFDEKDIEDVETNDEKINEKYIKGEVRIVTEQARYPLNTIPLMLETNKYELNPDFQRRRRWSNEKKSKLIESFIMNVPIPPIFLYENEYSHYEVMDGLQRLTTIADFYRDNFELTGLKLWQELNGRTYSKLPEKIKQGIDRRYISSIILLQESAKTESKAKFMKQMVFERINSGGVKLEPQETRNALYDGKMNQLCSQLSRNKNLCYFLKIPNDDEVKEGKLNDLQNNEIYRKMGEVEYVLRFFAMRQLEGYSQRKLSEFLDFYLNKANQFDDNLLENLKRIFEETIELAYDLLGECAFYMYRKRTMKGERAKWSWYSRTTTTIYDPMMQSLSKLIKKKKILLSHKTDVRKEIKEFYKAHYDVFEGRNNNKSDIEQRIVLLDEFFAKFVG